MKSVIHKLYPISYLDDMGEQVDTIWNFRPTDDRFWSGEEIVVSMDHPEAMDVDARSALIAALEFKLEKLRSVA